MIASLHGGVHRGTWQSVAIPRIFTYAHALQRSLARFGDPTLSSRVSGVSSEKPTSSCSANGGWQDMQPDAGEEQGIVSGASAGIKARSDVIGGRHQLPVPAEDPTDIPSVIPSLTPSLTPSRIPSPIPSQIPCVSHRGSQVCSRVWVACSASIARVRQLESNRRPASAGDGTKVVHQLVSDERPHRISWCRTVGRSSAGVELEAVHQLESNWSQCISWSRTVGHASAGVETTEEQASRASPKYGRQ